MTDLSGLSVDELAEKVGGALPNPHWAHAALSELVRRASERDQAVEELRIREQSQIPVIPKAAKERLDAAEAERDQAVRERDEADERAQGFEIEADAVQRISADRNRERERADRLAAALEGLITYWWGDTRQAGDHATVTDARDALAADQEQTETCHCGRPRHVCDSILDRMAEEQT